MIDNKSGIPLAYIKEGTKVQIIRIDANELLKAKLNAMGFVPETPLYVVKNSTKGPLVISIKGARIIIAFDIAQNIMVA